MKKLIQLVLAFSCSLLLVGCDSSSKSSDSSTQTSDESTKPPPGLPSDYFPTDVGHRWSYKIELKDGFDALNHSVICWGRLATEERGRYLLFKKEDKNDLHLVIRIKAKASKQGPLQYSEGYELAIEKDDLRIFERSDKIFWAISSRSRYEVTQVITRDPNGFGSPGSGSAWGSYGSEPGYGLRFLLFGEKPGIQMGISGENDDLLFAGQTNYNGKPALMFVRSVGARELKDGETMNAFYRAFTEQMIFVRGVGLAKLVQKVGDDVTMTWTLEDSAPAK